MVQKFQNPHNSILDLGYDLSKEEINNLGIEDILYSLEQCSAKGNITARNLFSLTMRLIDIAYYEADISEEQQQLAIRLIEPMIKDVESGLSNNPEGLASFRELYTFQLKNVEAIGRDSLLHKIETLSAQEVFQEIIKRENASKLPAFLKVYDKKTWNLIYPAILKALIIDRTIKENKDMEDTKLSNWSTYIALVANHER